MLTPSFNDITAAGSRRQGSTQTPQALPRSTRSQSAGLTEINRHFPAAPEFYPITPLVIPFATQDHTLDSPDIQLHHKTPSIFIDSSPSNSLPEKRPRKATATTEYPSSTKRAKKGGKKAPKVPVKDSLQGIAPVLAQTAELPDAPSPVDPVKLPLLRKACRSPFWKYVYPVSSDESPTPASLYDGPPLHASPPERWVGCLMCNQLTDDDTRFVNRYHSRS